MEWVTGRDQVLKNVTYALAMDASHKHASLSPLVHLYILSNELELINVSVIMCVLLEYKVFFLVDCVRFSLGLANIGTQTAGGRTGAVVRGVGQYKYSAGVRNVQQVISAPAPVVHQVK